MIVKVQVQYFSAPAKARVLISSENRYVQEKLFSTPEIDHLMHGRTEAFFHAQVDNHGRNVKLISEAPWQAW